MAGASCFLPFVTRLDTSLLLAPRAVLGWAVGMVTVLDLMAEMEGGGVHVRSQKPMTSPAVATPNLLALPGDQVWYPRVLQQKPVSYLPQTSRQELSHCPCSKAQEVTWLLEQ